MGLPVESTTELFALDSFQNLLFSIARFREYTGRYPAHITVVGYAFKAKRFEELHARALRWPVNKLTYIGVELSDQADEAQAAQGEVRLRLSPLRLRCTNMAPARKLLPPFYPRLVRVLGTSNS